MWVVAMAFGVLGVVGNLLVYQQNTRKRLLWVKLIAESLWVFHYVFLSAWSGAAINAVGALREGVYLNSHRRWGKSPLWPALFILLSLLSAALTWESPFCVLPAIGSVLSVIGYRIGNPHLARVLQLIISPCFLVYNITVLSYMGIVSEILNIGSVFVGFYRFSAKNK